MASRLNNCIRGCFLLLVAFSSIIASAFGIENKRESFALSHYIMAGVYDKTGDTREAIREYKQALRAD